MHLWVFRIFGSKLPFCPRGENKKEKLSFPPYSAAERPKGEVEVQSCGIGNSYPFPSCLAHNHACELFKRVLNVPPCVLRIIWNV